MPCFLTDLRRGNLAPLPGIPAISVSESGALERKPVVSFMIGQ